PRNNRPRYWARASPLVAERRVEAESSSAIVRMWNSIGPWSGCQWRRDYTHLRNAAVRVGDAHRVHRARLGGLEGSGPGELRPSSAKAELRNPRPHQIGVFDRR